MKYYIKGGNELHGEIIVPSAKNALLPMMAAALTARGKTTFYNCPNLSDLCVMAQAIKELGASCCQKGRNIEVDGGHLDKSLIEADIAGKMRSSVFLLSPMLAVCGRAELCFPGGCKIGARPIDIHLNGLRALGVGILECEDRIIANAAEARCGDCFLRYPSVGATENLVIFACSLKGKTRIYNAATEPEVTDLCNMLNKMGAKIGGIGDRVLEIDGGHPLHGIDYTPIPDRICAGTFITATLLCGGEVRLIGRFCDYLENYFNKIKNRYCNIHVNDDIITVIGNGQVDICDQVSTGAYPAFATDLQPMIAVAMANSNGRHLLNENVFEDRFRYLDELKKGGCVFERYGSAVLIRGGRLHGADYICPDLRAGAALFVAALSAEGRSTISDEGYIARGYEDLSGSFVGLGADVSG